MPDTHDPQQNRLLGELSPAERRRVYPRLELVPMPLGVNLYESGSAQAHVYFPTDSIVSPTPSQAVVRSAGHAYRLTAPQLQEECDCCDEMQLLLLRYTLALLTQMAQTALCKRYHSLDQQLCRWLLLSLDRLSSHKLTTSQEFISTMLGVPREGVTEAAGKLQALGTIHFADGQITVLHRPKLEQLSCECYAVIRKESERLLSQSLRLRS
jgi:CRP-like cAMP-binding protein